MLIFLTGPIGSGKTTACWKALPRLRASGIRVAGFVAPALVDETGRKTGIELVDLRCGEHQTLARVALPGESTTVGIYRMVEGAPEWARNVMAAALLANVDWLVIDEIGPLELHQGAGFAFALEPLGDPLLVPNAVVMVRESLVDELAERVGRLDGLQVLVAADARSELPGYLASLMRPVSSCATPT